MDQQKIGNFLKALRKDQGITQERLAETLGVTSRSVSRWENGVNMPDFDVLIHLAKIYGVGMEEILNGERKDMDQQKEKTMHLVAEYTNMEKERLIGRLHGLSWVGLGAWGVWIGLDAAGLAESGATGKIAAFAVGLAFGMAIITVIYTSKQALKIRAFKQRLLGRKGEKQ